MLFSAVLFVLLWTGFCNNGHEARHNRRKRLNDCLIGKTLKQPLLQHYMLDGSVIDTHLQDRLQGAVPIDTTKLATWYVLFLHLFDLAYLVFTMFFMQENWCNKLFKGSSSDLLGVFTFQV